MFYWIKRLIAGKDLDALARYRQAANLAGSWNGQLPNSAETAHWIQAAGEGRIGADIEGFRRAMQNGNAKEFIEESINWQESMRQWSRRWPH